MKAKAEAMKFQSTPAIADGRTKGGSYTDTTTGGFNPRPPSLTGEPVPWAMDTALEPKFQSTPAIADGRTCGVGFVMMGLPSFNPRPPSLTGEPAAGAAQVLWVGVSIHARHR